MSNNLRYSTTTGCTRTGGIPQVKARSPKALNKPRLSAGRFPVTVTFATPAVIANAVKDAK